MLKKKLLNKTPIILFFILFITSSLYAVHDYANALYLATYFYGAQRCGNTSSWCHGACHVKDGLAPGGPGIDLTGGWHDCGDHVTFGQTAPYAAGVLIAGYLMNPSAYEDRYSQANSAPPSNGIPDVLDEAKIMTDLLIKCITGGKFYYQKGNGDYDHKHMDEPMDFSQNYIITEGGETDGGRPLSSVTSGGSNVCGDAAAALAYMAIAYAPYDAAYATTCFTKAKEVYAIGDTSPGTVSGGSYYGAANYQDDMAWGGAVINRASKFRGAPENTYLTKSQAYITGGQGAGSWPLCYDHTEAMAHYELYLLANAASDLTWLQNEVAWYKTKMTTCGIGQYSWVTTWGSLRYAANMAFAAMMLYDLNGDNTAYTFAKSNIDFILGTHGDIAGAPNCPQGRSFLIGYTNPDYPAQGSVMHPHHRAAFGKTKASGADTQWQTENTTPGSIPYLYQLKGGLVGGPQSACGTYNDRIDDYTSNEVGVDYNAGLVGALAAIKYVLNPSTPTNTPVVSKTYTRTATYTATNTNTSTATITLTATRTNTPTFTTTNTPVPPTATFTLTATRTNTPTFTTTNTPLLPTATFTLTATRTNTNTPTVISTNTLTSTFTSTVIFTSSRSATPTYTRTMTDTNTFTASPTATYTGTGTFTPSYTPTSTMSSSGTSTRTPTPGNTMTFTSTPSFTRTQTSTAGITPTFTVSNTHTVSPTDTPYAGSPTYTPTITTTYTFTLTYTLTSTRTFTETDTNTSTETSTPTFSSTFTSTPSFTQTTSSTLTSTQSLTVTLTATYTGTVLPTASFTSTQIDTMTETPTVIFTVTFTATATPIMPSATSTSTNTETLTSTPTSFKTNTPTATLTLTIEITLTNTPEIIAIVVETPVFMYPNPNPTPGSQPDRTISFEVNRPVSGTVFRIYTQMGRLIRKYEDLSGQYPGSRSYISIDSGYFKGLARGVYYYVIIVKDKATGRQAKSPIGKFIVQ